VCISVFPNVVAGRLSNFALWFKHIVTMSDLEDLSMDDLLYASQSERKDGGEGDEDDEQPTTSSGGIPITVDRYVCTQGTNGEGRVQTCGQLPMG